jgi:hypothetical protein
VSSLQCFVTVPARHVKFLWPQWRFQFFPVRYGACRRGAGGKKIGFEKGFKRLGNLRLPVALHRTNLQIKEWKLPDLLCLRLKVSLNQIVGPVIFSCGERGSGFP